MINYELVKIVLDGKAHPHNEKQEQAVEKIYRCFDAVQEQFQFDREDIFDPLFCPDEDESVLNSIIKEYPEARMGSITIDTHEITEYLEFTDEELIEQFIEGYTYYNSDFFEIYIVTDYNGDLYPSSYISFKFIYYEPKEQS